MDKNEALKLGLQVVEAAEYLANNPAIFGEYVQQKRALKRALIQRNKIAFEEALAQPEQEPVPWATREDYYRELNRSVEHIRKEMEIKSVTMRCKDYDLALPIINTHFGRVLVGQVFAPSQRKWVGLTDEEVSKLIDIEIGFNSCCGWEEKYTRAVEAKLREKNGC